jgi:hypothetical protein
MLNHAIWAMGILGDLLILVVLFTRRRFPRFPWFTLLIAFHFLVAISLKTASHFSGHADSGFTANIIDLTDVLLQCAVVAELIWIALRPLAGLRRLLLPLLLVVLEIFIVLRHALATHHSLPEVLVLLHTRLLFLRLEWAIVLVFLLPSLRLTWRSHVAAISFGYGVFSAHQLAVDGYFATSREISDYASSPSFRILVYLLTLLWWLVSLWQEEPNVR